MMLSGPGKEQRIAYTSMTKNEGGGFVFRNVGDNNPRVIFESNSILECGYPTLNMTSPALVDVFIQNSRMLTISNNYIARSAGGGILVNTTTKDNEVALYANITNNVILFNTHGEPLHLEGNHIVSLHLDHIVFSYFIRNTLSFFRYKKLLNCADCLKYEKCRFGSSILNSSQFQSK